MMKINIEKTVNLTQKKWHCHEREKLFDLIKKTLVRELCKIEERKLVRRDQIEINKKKKAKAEIEREN